MIIILKHASYLSDTPYTGVEHILQCQLVQILEHRVSGKHRGRLATAIALKNRRVRRILPWRRRRWG